MANKANNARSASSRAAIRDAVTRLLHGQDLTSISVRDVCSMARVSRSTFYTHFDNIDGLLKQLEDDFLQGLKPYFDKRDTRQIGPDVQSPYLSTFQWFEYCIAHRDYLHGILGQYGDPGFEHRMRIRLRKEVNDMMNVDKMPDDKNRRFVIEYTVSAILSLLRSLMEDADGTTPQQITFIANIIREGPILLRTLGSPDPRQSI